MKKTISLFGLLLSTLAFAQESEYKLTKDGFTDFIVIKKEGKSASELYNKTLEWINKNYKNPEKVILGKVENDYIRIEGVHRNMFCIKQGCSDGKYSIEISFKDGKYKFDVVSLEQNIGAWVPVDFNANKNFYMDQNGLKKKFERYHSVPEDFNSLNKSLSDYISGTGNESSKNGW